MTARDPLLTGRPTALDLESVKAISIRQPWTWAIVGLPRGEAKGCENRDWHPESGNLGAARRLVGTRILIHAAKGCTLAEYRSAVDFMSDGPGIGVDRIPRLASLQRGGIVGSARLAGVVETDDEGHRRQFFGAACSLCGGSAPLPEDFARKLPRCPKADPWALDGCVGLLLADVEPLPFVPFAGSLGFFEVPDALLALVGAA